ncbi:MAG: zinc-binding dehydrogenase [Propionibacteriales bacterium]|nr:zinc-binding dehydrogenase [Propionibacteriales bacterium]
MKVDQRPTMRAAFMPEPGRIEISDFPIPEPQAGEILIEMTHASVCGSDVHVVHDGFHQPARLGVPGYPGHEGVGTVIRTIETGPPVGSQVLTVPRAANGGCFAEFQAIPANQVVVLPVDTNPLEMLMAQQLGTTIYALRRLWTILPETPRTALVIGSGSAGLYFIQQLLRAGVEQVIAADLNPARCAAAKAVGAAHVVQAPDADVVSVCKDLTDGLGVDVVIEAAGSDECRAQAIEAVRVDGTVLAFGYPQRLGMAPFPVRSAFARAVTVQWVRDAQGEPGQPAFAQAIADIASGAIDVSMLLSDPFALADTERAVRASRDRELGAGKVIISIQ